jgi:uroporphyrinogen-III synthase
MRVLVTRPEPDASRTAANLRRLGHEAVVDPLLAIEPLAAIKIPAGPFAGVGVTSATAMRAATAASAATLLDPVRALPLYAVGAHTAEAAREAGFKNVRHADGDAAALAGLIVRELPAASRVLHLAGEDRAQDLGRLLAPHGIEVAVLELYRMRPAEKLGASAAALASGLDAVLHFSPRSAATFVALAEREGLGAAARRPRHLCLSQAVAASLAPLGVTPEIAAAPNEAALLALLNS